VVIAILSWNKLGLLKSCLAALERHTDYPHTVCVVDQASTDGTREYLARLEGRAVHIAPAENLGFVKGNNLVMARFPDHDVVLLNNDTQVQSGWLTALADRAYSTPEVGIVGAKLVYPDGRLQEAGGEIFRDGSGRNIGKGEDPDRLLYNRVREVDYCSGACLYLKRDVLDRVGVLDEQFHPAYFEDSDLCFSAAAAGFLVLYEPAALVVHLEGATAGKGDEAASGARLLQEQNRPKFVAKWRHVLAGKRPSAYALPVTPGREKLLFIGPFVPMHDTASGELRWFLTIKELARDFDIVYLGRNATPVRYINDLEALGVTVLCPDPDRMRQLGFEVPGPYLDLPALLAQNDFTAVIVGFHHVAHQYLPLIRRHAPKSCRIVDTHDIHYMRAWRKAEMAAEPALFWDAEEEKRRELRVYAGADLVLTVTEQDRQALLADAPGLDVRLAPNIHDPISETVEASLPERRDLVFVGGFRHPPNEDAVVWFADAIFPRIRAALPDVRLFVVGSEPTERIQALASEAIVVTGYVPSVLPYLNRCRISVAPLRYGAGMKGKVGEALAAGIPVVTTVSGAEGMGLDDGRHALIATEAASFADAVIRLYRDGDLRTRLAAEGRRLMAARYGSESVGRHWRETVSAARRIRAGREAEAGGEPIVEGAGHGTGSAAGFTWLPPRPRLTPDLTIVIPVHNGLKLTQQCVETIRRFTTIPYRVLLVDNGSTDGTAEWAEADNVECLALGSNRGFAAGCNAGIRAALGTYVAILNNDTVLSPGWAEGLLRHLEADPSVGLVGPSTNYASSCQQTDAGYNGLDEYLRFAKRVARTHAGDRVEVDRLVGVCLLARRSLFEEVGLFDERFGLGNYEDDDFCLRVRLAGYRLLWAKDVFIHHVGSQTFAALPTSYQALLERNRTLLRDKWDLRPHLPERLRHLLAVPPSPAGDGRTPRVETPPEPSAEVLEPALRALREERWEEAAAQLAPLGRAYPGSAVVQACWGRALGKLGRAADAEARLRRATALAPAERAWLLWLVQFFLEGGRVRAAETTLRGWQQGRGRDEEIEELLAQLQGRTEREGAFAGSERIHG
jgi:GT2 family glycosyltransferase/glycosyltransferase involved in cell wall biosynthesis